MRDGAMHEFCDTAESLLDGGLMPRPPEDPTASMAARFSGWFSHRDVAAAMKDAASWGDSEYSEAMSFCHSVLNSLDDAYGHQSAARRLSKILERMSDLSMDRAAAKSEGLAVLAVSSGPMASDGEAMSVLCFSKWGLEQALSGIVSGPLAGYVTDDEKSALLMGALGRALREASGGRATCKTRTSRGGGGSVEAYPVLDLEVRGSAKDFAAIEEACVAFMDGVFGGAAVMERSEGPAGRLGYLLEMTSRMDSVAQAAVSVVEDLLISKEAAPAPSARKASL